MLTLGIDSSTQGVKAVAWDVGAKGDDTVVTDPSDAELFRAFGGGKGASGHDDYPPIAKAKDND